MRLLEVVGPRSTRKSGDSHQPRVVLRLPDFGMLRRVLPDTDLLCTVSDALADALMDSLAAVGLAVDPLPFPSPGETAVRMAWRAALD